MDYFFAQIEEKENPQFKGKPVVVGADPKEGKGRGVVSTCNYLARRYGIKSAMPISKAYQLCPKAIFLPVNLELYQKVSERIMEIIKRYSSKWEIVSLDEAYLDISFLEDFEKAEDLAKKLKNEILEKEKLTATIGIGPNKLIAKMAAEKAKRRSELYSTTEAKPNGLLIIKSDRVKKFLEPLDIEDLPGIGPKTAEKLREIGINKIKELKKLSKAELKDMFGKAGETIYDRARGIDEEPVTSEEIIKSIGKEHTFEKDTRDPEIIFGAFEELIEDVGRELFSANLSFKTITVICRFSGFETHTKSKTLKEPTRNLEILGKEAKKLLLRFLVENPKLIRLVGIRVSILS
jgi:DNA polymerase IV (DinB-like DNA polymerase)